MKVVRTLVSLTPVNAVRPSMVHFGDRPDDSQEPYTQQDLDDAYRRWSSTMVQQRLERVFTHLLGDPDVVSQLTGQDWFSRQLHRLYPRSPFESVMDPLATIVSQPPALAARQLLKGHNATIQEEYTHMTRQLGHHVYDAAVWDDWQSELHVLEPRIFHDPPSSATQTQLFPRLAAAVGVVNRYTDTPPS